MTEIVQVTTTVDDEGRAASIAQTVVEEGLAACAQVQGPILSIYRWQGSIKRSTEWYCHFKTTRPQVDRLRTLLLQLHPYDVPEVIVIPIQDGHEPYFAWVHDQTRGDTHNP
jgi:periplasmic divalent cation tolerance protein